ncbi:MAG: allantoin racemase, partial [Thermomicrobiales bacterium]|nr:allantoin racemase [Thermomicrobiales bacterium]
LLTGRSTSDYCQRLTDLLSPLVRPDVELTVNNIPDGPTSLEYGYQEAQVMPLLIDAIRRAESSYDGVVIGCFLDPGLHTAREVVSIPVVGLGHSSLQLATTLGHKIGVLAGLRRLVPAIERMVHGYGMDYVVGAIESTELTVSDMRINPKGSTAQVAEIVQNLVDHRQVDVIVGGCGSLGEIFENLRVTTAVPLIDARVAAIKQLEMLVDLYRLGFAKTSKVGLYELPPAGILAAV